MMESIAGMSMSMSAAQFESAYSIAMTKKTMDLQEMAGQELLEMLPQQPQITVPKGQYIDVYA